MTNQPYRIPPSPPAAPSSPPNPASLTALIAAIVGLVLCVGTGIHELQYRADHPFASGPAGVIAVLSFGAALGCLAAALLAWNSLRIGR